MAKSALRFPQELIAARLAVGMQQKTLALSAGVDQSHLCAIEKGRGSPPTGPVVTRLIDGLKASAITRKQLQIAALHDRVLQQISDSGLSLNLELLSVALQLASLLNHEEVIGVTRQLKSIKRSKDLMLHISAKAETPENEEVT